MEDSYDKQNDQSIFDRLLNKYIGVWLWSILFGTTTGVIYSFLSFRYDRWGGLAIVLVVPAILSLLSAIMSWLQLYGALRYYLLPNFFSELPDSEKLSPKLFARYIHRAFYFFIVSASFRAIASILEFLLASASRG